jgi:lipopolysaccharide biosynthesis protein
MPISGRIWRAISAICGTMMFLRTSVLKETYIVLREIEFEDGDNRPLEFHRDGQIAHAVERLIGNNVRKQGYEFAWR